MNPLPRLALVVLLLTSAAACQPRQPTEEMRMAALEGIPTDGLSQPRVVAELEAKVVPPLDWTPTRESGGRHVQHVWVSPDGGAAYGVIRFALPFPVGVDLALRGFLHEMRRSEGQADLLQREYDRTLPGIRFVAQGGRYKVRTNLIVRGWRGWAVYAGTRVGREFDPAELDLAERAREHTRVGITEDEP